MPELDDREDVYQVADEVRRRVLRDGDSLFREEKSALWRGEALVELTEAYPEMSQGGDGSFFDSLEEQLGDASENAIQLMAEALFVHFLVALPSAIGGDKKREHIERVLDWMDEPVSIPKRMDEVLDSGLVVPGTGFMAYRSAMVGYLLEFAEQWADLKGERRTELLDDPWAFRDFVFDVDLPSSATQRHALCHLMFPETFEPMVSEEDKRAVVNHFSSYVDDESLNVDQKLKRIRAGLTRDRGEPFVGFYDDDIRSKWEETEPGATVSSNELADDLFIDDSEFGRIQQLLADRKNVILRGPPGVGKTYMAERIAWGLMGERADKRVQTVQFHQSYTYEDFVQGYRPDGAGGFERKDGVFHDFCRRANWDPENEYVFIIDEINRADLTTVFGELMMLIERDKRGSDHAIPLQHAESEDEPFHVPENVHLLGTINTAEHSSATVDHGLRRRFAFADLEPAFGRPSFDDYLAEHGVSAALIERIDSQLGVLNRQIALDERLGPEFRIGHGYFTPREGEDRDYDEEWFRSVVQHDVAPLLRDYWPDQPDKAQHHIDQLLGD